jgi:hypothetical protein
MDVKSIVFVFGQWSWCEGCWSMSEEFAILYSSTQCYQITATEPVTSPAPAGSITNDVR